MLGGGFGLGSGWMGTYMLGVRVRGELLLLLLGEDMMAMIVELLSDCGKGGNGGR